ncbi:MAG: glycosyltransferase family 1 protein, partial [Vicinamibacterales bacterium]
MTALRVAIIADYLEEGWPSMDLVADMLFDRLQREHSATVSSTLIRPAMRRRAARMPGAARAAWVRSADRIAGRMWDYPKLAAGLATRFDLFHIVDHSYAQLVHRLPAGRTIVTCHDLDTFRSVLDSALERRSFMFRAMT